MPDGFSTPQSPAALGHPEPVSIAALARHICNSVKAEERLPDTQRQISYVTGAYDQRSAMRDLILTLPARTLADAFAQIAIAASEMDNIVDGVDSNDYNLKVSARGVLRSLISAYFALKDALGPDAPDMCDPWYHDMWQQEFGAIEQAMKGGVA